MMYAFPDLAEGRSGCVGIPLSESIHHIADGIFIGQLEKQIILRFLRASPASRQIDLNHAEVPRKLVE